MVLCCSVKKLVMESPSTLLNTKKNTLNGMSEFVTYSALGFLPILLRLLQAEQELQIFPPASSLAELVVKTFRWPKLKGDEMNSSIYVHGSGRQSYLADLWNQAESYISSVSLYSKKCFPARRLLDTPNKHILMKLFVLTVSFLDTLFSALISRLRQSINQLNCKFPKALPQIVT